jgi:hypothetical protein
VRNRRTATSVVTLMALVISGLVGAAGPATGHQPAGPQSIPALPLGAADLPQSVTGQQLAPGVTLHRIVRGEVDPATRWVVELSIPPGDNPDPDAPGKSVQDKASARALVDRLAAAGFPAQAQPVWQPRTADVAASVIGYRVRLTATFGGQVDAKAAVARLKAAGFTGRDWYTGWDGGSDVRGRWTVNVLTIDPRRFHGELGATFGPNIENRETTSALSGYVGATAAINAGFFVLDPAAGAPGDPAGVGVYHGTLESETVAGRPALLLDSRARHTAVIRPSWRGTLSAVHRTVTLDGLNRVPGLIRNCGGIGDTPTDRPLHDTTCTDPDELVAFTTAFGASTPSGAGAEAVIDQHGKVLGVHGQRGQVLRAGQRSVQATGDRTHVLTALHEGQHVRLRTVLTDGRAELARKGVTVVNGGPQLMRHGQVHITQRQDGMVHPDDPSFAYGWALQRNPRTFAGVDARGRTLLVTVDGRQLGELGLSVPETAAVAKALGMVDAINLDGGGSTAMAVRGELVSHPSDATGERPVGDAIFVR